MSRVHKHILLKSAPLTPSERAEIQKHPVHGVALLEKVRSVAPASAKIALYQTHERSDGGGYPRKRSSQSIHEYAKVIAVADTYAALRSPRPWREAKLPYEAMETVVRGAAERRLDLRAVRGLLQVAGLYPIGSWVQLNTGEIARVIGKQAGDKSDRPQVMTFISAQGLRLEHPRLLDLACVPSLKVVKALPAAAYERDVLMGFG